MGIKARFGWATDYPLGELISCGGFFLVFAVEEIVVSFLQGGHGHSHAPAFGSGSSDGHQRTATFAAFSLFRAPIEKVLRPVLVHVHGKEESPLHGKDEEEEGGGEETALQPTLAATDVIVRGSSNGQPILVSTSPASNGCPTPAPLGSSAVSLSPLRPGQVALGK